MTKSDLEKLEKFEPHKYKKYYIRLDYDYLRSNGVMFILKCYKPLKSYYEVQRLNGKIEISENPKCKFGDLDRIRQLVRREVIIMQSYSVDNLLENYKWVIDLKLKNKMHYKVYRKKLQRLFINLEITISCKTK